MISEALCIGICLYFEIQLHNFKQCLMLVRIVNVLNKNSLLLCVKV